jgi:hypothetical protein
MKNEIYIYCHTIMELIDHALLENWAFVPGPFFELYRVFIALVQITTFVPGGVIAWYK